MSAPRSGGAVAAQRVLVVDDNADACEMLRLALDEAGHEPCVAGNGSEATRGRRRGSVPRWRSSTSACRAWTATSWRAAFATRIRDIRLIALTGYGRSGDLEAATAAGFDAHCAKPIAIAALLALIAGEPA